MTRLELQKISVQLGSQRILHELSLCLEAGQRLVLMGASGAGKTTLLRVIAGLQHPSAGLFLVDGQPASTTPSKQLRIALLTQDYALYPQLSVEQNIAAALKQQGLSPTEIATRVRQVSNWFDIETLRERLPSQISGGQAQRVAFAKALARQPQLLLLDEPFSQVDCGLRSQLVDTLMSACEQLQTTVCWVTHDPQEAFRVASRIAVLDDGQLVQNATAQEIYRSPASRRVADLTSVWPVNWLPLDQPEFAILREDSHCKIVGVRPEHFSVPTDQQPMFNLEVQRFRFLGFARLIQGLIGQTPVHMLDLQQQCQIGDTIQISVDSNKILRISQ